MAIATGLVSTIAGSTRGFLDGQGTEAKFNYPSGLAVAPDGTLYVADFGNYSIRKITAAGKVTTTVKRINGSTTDIALSPDGSTVYVVYAGANQILKAK